MEEKALVAIEALNGYERLVGELEHHLFDDIGNWNDFELRFLRAEGLKGVTYSNLRSGMKMFFERFLGMKLSPFRITIAHIESFYDAECERTSPATASMRIGQIRRFFNKFCDEVPLCRNPFSHLDEKLVKKFRQPRYQFDERRYLRKVELEMLFRYLEKLGEKEYWLFFMFVMTKFLFFTGLRIGEATQLRWKDLERFSDQDGQFRYRCMFIGKGQKDYSSQRVPEDVAHLLHKMWKRRYSREPLPDEWVFQMIAPRYYGRSVRQSPRMNGTEAATLYTEVSKLVNESGLFSFKVKLHPHAFRHNLAVYLRNELGWDPREIQLILRHRSIETTTQFYFHDKVRPVEDFVF
jgi:integrase